MRASRPLFFGLILVLHAASVRAQMGPASVDLAPVERRPIELTQPLVASIEPVTRSVLAVEVAGLIEQRNFDEGQFITPKDVLVRMRTDLITAEHNAAIAAQTSAKASIERAKAQAENSANRLKRVRKAFESGVTGVDELVEAETLAKVGAADVRVAEAVLVEKDAEVARLKLLLDKSTMSSPIPGMVVKRHVEVGQWVEQGKPIAEIVWLSPLWVRVNVPENVVGRVKQGDEAVVVVDALSHTDNGGRFVAIVDQVIPEADPGSRSFPVKLKLENKESQVRPGMFARASLLSPSDGALLMVPRDAIVSRGPDAHVVVARNGTAAIVPVTRGPSSGQYIAVTPHGELKEGDMVVAKGNEALRGGEMLMPRKMLPAFVPTTRPTTGPTTGSTTGPPTQPTTE